jgi:hypothetical protein
LGLSLPPKGEERATAHDEVLAALLDLLEEVERREEASIDLMCEILCSNRPGAADIHLGENIFDEARRPMP